MSPKPFWPRLFSVATLGAVVGAEWLEGRRWWCKCGKANLWVSDVWSDHCSQHLADPYSFTHISHGLVFYGLIAWLPGPQRRLSFAWKFFIANLAECAWEVLENSDFIISRYRAETISIGYIGDSIANSLGDIACCAIGVVIAHILGFRLSLLLFLLMEMILLVAIRDNLTLNVVMLLWPIQALKHWQSAGRPGA